jgi:hypothetical protein
MNASTNKIVLCQDVLEKILMYTFDLGLCVLFDCKFIFMKIKKLCCFDKQVYQFLDRITRVNSVSIQELLNRFCEFTQEKELVIYNINIVRMAIRNGNVKVLECLKDHNLFKFSKNSSKLIYYNATYGNFDIFLFFYDNITNKQGFMRFVKSDIIIHKCIKKQTTRTAPLSVIGEMTEPFRTRISSNPISIPIINFDYTDFFKYLDFFKKIIYR